MNLDLKNKIVVVTASGQGIGNAIAERFLMEGAKVVINDRDKEKLDKSFHVLWKKYGNKVKSFCGDITDKEIIKKMKSIILKEWKRVDILIPNLGSGKPLTTDKMDINEWERFMNINLYSTIKLINNFLPLMKKRKTGSIVLISSIVGLQQTKAPYGYAAAKSAILTLVKNLSFEIAKDNIRINAVAPGNIYFKKGRWEEIISKDPTVLKNYIKKDVPLGRLGKPEEVAAAVVFLASPISAFTTGACLVIDGGEVRKY